MLLLMVFATMLFTVVTPSAIRVESCNATGVSRPIENLEQLIGTTKILYMYSDLPITGPICVDNVISVPNIQEISAYETVCGKVGDIKLKIKESLFELSGFISQDNNKTYIRFGCQTAEVQLRSVDNYVLWVLPELNIIELSGEAVLSKEELQCVADKVDVTQGMKGLPICWKV